MLESANALNKFSLLPDIFKKINEIIMLVLLGGRGGFLPPIHSLALS
jgi:hypothetical protein